MKRTVIRKAQRAQLGDGLLGRAVMNAAHADGRAPSTFARTSSMKTASAGWKPPSAAVEIVDRRVGLRSSRRRRTPHSRGNGRGRDAVMGRPAQPGVEEAGGVGQKVKRRSGAMEALDQVSHVRKACVAHLVEAIVEGRDQRLLARMLRLQAACRLAGSPPWSCTCAIREVVTVARKSLHLPADRDQLPVEVARIPVEQDATHVEDRDRGALQGHFLGANHETFP